MSPKKCAASAELLFCRRRRPQRSMLDDSRIFGKDVSAHARVHAHPPLAQTVGVDFKSENSCNMTKYGYMTCGF